MYGEKESSIDILDQWNIAPKWHFAIKVKTTLNSQHSHCTPFFNNVSDIEIDVGNFLLVNFKRSKHYVMQNSYLLLTTDQCLANTLTSNWKRFHIVQNLFIAGNACEYSVCIRKDNHLSTMQDNYNVYGLINEQQLDVACAFKHLGMLFNFNGFYFLNTKTRCRTMP